MDRSTRRRSAPSRHWLAGLAVFTLALGAAAFTAPSVGATAAGDSSHRSPIASTFHCAQVDAPFTAVDTTIEVQGDAPATARFGDRFDVTGISVKVGADLTGVPAAGDPAPTVSALFPSVIADGASVNVPAGQLSDTVVAPGGGFAAGVTHVVATMWNGVDEASFEFGGLSFSITSVLAGTPVVRGWNCNRVGPFLVFASTRRVDPVHDALLALEADLASRSPGLPPGPAALADAAATLLGDGPSGARTALAANDWREASRRMLRAQLLIHAAVDLGAPSLYRDEVALTSSELALGGDTVRLAFTRSGCESFASTICPISIIQLLVVYTGQLNSGQTARDRGQLVIAGVTALIVVDRAAAVNPNPF